MTRISLVLWVGMIPVLGLVSSANIIRAAELKVLASVALTSSLDELTPVYEKETGDKLSIGYSLAADLKKRLLDGEPPM
jgi:molybdate transport system substrate-binding protein